MAVTQNVYTNITTNTTTTVRSGAGVLRYITVNKPVGSAVTTIYDSKAASGTKIGTITMPATPTENNFTLRYNVVFTTGLTIVTDSSVDITVCWSPQ